MPPPQPPSDETKDSKKEKEDQKENEEKTGTSSPGNAAGAPSTDGPAQTAETSPSVSIALGGTAGSKPEGAPSPRPASRGPGEHSGRKMRRGRSWDGGAANAASMEPRKLSINWLPRTLRNFANKNEDADGRPVAPTGSQCTVTEGETRDDKGAETMKPRPSTYNVETVLDKTLFATTYYFGYIQAKDLEVFLRRDGDFLMCMMAPESFDKEVLILVVRHKGRGKCFPVKSTGNRYYVAARSFDTIQAMITYYMTTRECLHRELPIVLKNAAIIPSWIIQHDKVVVKGRLGRGQYGKVYRAQIQGENTYFAVKTYKSTGTAEDLQRRASFLQEAERMRMLKHDNVICFVGLGSMQEPLMLILEYAANGSLLKVLKENANKTSKQQYLQFATEAAAGLRYLDKLRLLHRDVAARNCLISHSNQLKISDFGLSIHHKGQPIVESGLNLAIKWLAPEILLKMEFSPKTDVWAFGILICEIYADGNEPYTGLRNPEVRKGLTDGSQLRSEIPEAVPREVNLLIRSCWYEEASQRPTMKQLHKQLVSLKDTLFAGS